MKGYTRSEVARKVGINASTLRYYEQEGLLPAPPRTSGGYRVYTHTHIQVLQFILRARELGFSLETIRELLQLELHNGSPAEEVRACALRHLTDVRERIQKLKQLEHTLTQLVTLCQEANTSERCPILEALRHPTFSQSRTCT